MVSAKRFFLVGWGTPPSPPPINFACTKSIFFLFSCKIVSNGKLLCGIQSSLSRQPQICRIFSAFCHPFGETPNSFSHFLGSATLIRHVLHPQNKQKNNPRQNQNPTRTQTPKLNVGQNQNMIVYNVNTLSLLT